MSDNPAEKRPGFDRWVASLKIGAAMRPSSSPPPDPEEGAPLTLDEQATLINRIPKEVIYKLRERDSQRGMPKSDDSTAVFVPPPELLARARRFQAPPKPERSSPTTAPPPDPGHSVPEAETFATLNSEEEATTFFRPEITDVPASVPPPALADLSRPGDMQWIDELPTSRPPPFMPASTESVGPGPFPAGLARFPAVERHAARASEQPASSSIAPAERRVRWVALIVAVLLMAGIYALSRMQ